MKTFSLHLNYQILTFSFLLLAPLTVGSHLLLQSHKQSGGVEEVPLVESDEKVIEVVLTTYVAEPSGRVAKEQDIMMMTRGQCKKAFEEKITEHDEASLKERGYLKRTAFRVRGVF